MEISARFRYSNILKISHLPSDACRLCTYERHLTPLQNLERDSTSFTAITHYTAIRRASTVLFLPQHWKSRYNKKFGLASLLTQHRWLSGQAFEYFINSILKDSNMSKWQTLSYLSTYSLTAPGMHFPNYCVVKKQKHGHSSTKEIL